MLDNISKWKIISWAIVAGTVVALSMEIMLNFLGFGLGIIHVNVNNDNLYKIGVSSLIWLVVSGILSMGFGGWIAGTISNYACTKIRTLHGLLSWSFTTIVIVSASSSAIGSMLGGVASMIKTSINAMAKSPVANIVQDKIYADVEQVGAYVGSGTASPEAVVANYVGSAAMIIFVAFLLSALASMLGAYLAKPEKLETCTI